MSSNHAGLFSEKAGQHSDCSPSRPDFSRSNTFQGPTQLQRDSSPVSPARMTRVPSDNLLMRNQRIQLRPAHRTTTGNDLFGDPPDDSAPNSSPDRYYGERSASPATSHGSAASREGSSSTLYTSFPVGKKQAPPPPPSRTTKPPPPPPPTKRSALSTSNTPFA